MSNDLIIAADLGGTQIRVALCDAHGRFLERRAQPVRVAEGVEAVFARIATNIRAVAGDWSRVCGVGLGAPGPLDQARGIIFEAPNVGGMRDFPMKARLEKELGVPVFIGNDANLAALGEHRFGAGRGATHMIYVTVGTGIGGGIIADNRLFLGARGLAGEIGHQTIQADGPRCNCGNIGCLEALAAGPAIVRAARAALDSGRDSKMRALVKGDLEKITGTLVTQAARDGDLVAREILDRVGFYIGVGLVNLLHNFDTQLFVIGGGVAIHAWDFIYPPIQNTLEKYAMPSMRRGVRIVPAQLGDDAGLLGAAALVNEQMTNAK